MHKVELTKPDGRALILYSRSEIPKNIQAPSPQNESTMPEPHLRWHPLRGQWVAYASHRQNRTFLPPKEYNPLAPMSSEKIPTELPQGKYDVAVFENLFPTFHLKSKLAPKLFVPTAPAQGVCEVVVFTQDTKSSLSKLSLDHINLLVDVWIDRYQELGKRKEIKYVMPFENKGIEMGVTLEHPHGQIYAYPFIPPLAEKELNLNKKFYDEKGKSILEDMLENEIKDKKRLIYEDAHTLAFVPVCARYPYEVWMAPRKRLPSLAAMNPQEKTSFSRCLKTVLLKYDKLWDTPFPYLMTFHQAPTDGIQRAESHFHLEFYPPYRMKGRLKYLAGTELGADVFANDSLPEEKAAELQAVEVSVD